LRVLLRRLRVLVKQLPQRSNCAIEPRQLQLRLF
jgi:hypothetical protein